MTTRSLEDELVDLGARLDVPELTADAVSARLASSASVSRTPSPTRRSRHRTVWAAAAAAVVGATALLASPAVGDWFGVRGVEVNRGPAPTTTATTASGAAFDLGRPSTIADAAKVLGFAPVIPKALGKPDAVWLDDRTAAPSVSFVYDDGPLVSEFDATLAAGPVVTKFAQGAAVEELEIDGRRAMWIDGTHQVVLRARNGDYVPERLRQSDSVLLVERGPVTVRIETSAGREEAIRIARSLG